MKSHYIFKKESRHRRKATKTCFSPGKVYFLETRILILVYSSYIHMYLSTINTYFFLLGI